jgi:O-antigen/teichoic acid export membrane protein
MKTDFKKNVMTLLSGNLIAQMVSFATIPIISRIYSQEAFGEFNILISTAVIVSQFGTLGLNSAIMLPKDDGDARKIFQTTFIIHLMILSALLGVALCSESFIKIAEAKTSYSISCFIVYIFAILTNLSGLLSTYMNRAKAYKVMFWNALIGQISTLGVTIPLGLIGLGSKGFIIAGIISLIAVNLQMLYRLNPFIEFINFREIRYIIKNYKNMIKFQFSANIISTFCVQLPNQLISMSFGNVALGGYAMCQRLLGAPISLVAAPINTVYFQTASEYHRESNDLGEFTYILVRNIMLIGFIPLIALMVFAGPIFTFVLGNKWREAGLFASVLALQYLFMFCNNCTSYCRVAIEKPHINTVLAFVQILFIVTSMSIGIFYYKTLYSTIIAFAIGNTFYQIIDLGINFYLMKTSFIRFIVFISIYILSALSLVGGLRLLFQ